ncbi:MAG: HAD family hydrolase [Deltaproteobacteria bacterium]|nr:MAG: HAD family hydrolase [Deltaproteobacteria bacterium]
MKVVLFDIDGTLILSGGAGNRSLNKAFKKQFGLENAINGIKPDGKTDPAIIREMCRKNLSRDCREKELELLCKQYLHFLRREVPESPGYRIMPGIPELLEQLGSIDNVIVGLATGNLEEGARIKLGRGGLNRYFRFGGFGSDCEDRVELTKIAISRSREFADGEPKKQDIYIIGDTPFDIKSSTVLGTKSVAVATGFFSLTQLKEHQPDYLFPNLSNPEPFLRALS